jgi:hypothetical protein
VEWAKGIEHSPAGPAHLPPHQGLDRSAPDHRVHRLAVSRWIENRTVWAIRKFVKTARRYRTTQVQAGPHAITAPDPLPDDLRDALDHIHGRTGAH